MKKLIRKIRRFLFLSNSRLLSQIKVFQFLDNEDELTKSEKNTMIWYFKKMLLKDLNRFGQIDKAIEILKESEKERKEKEKTSEEVKN
ncbi:hypothetical protein [Chishuiella sp.]|uniref:hypothetical protein n=1 Tax=Chishuiella sp. TaxID=1969467 RepID=UPI0028A892B3|nr:hypothetical protein [Chishuiella sp.]